MMATKTVVVLFFLGLDEWFWGVCHLAFDRVVCGSVPRGVFHGVVDETLKLHIYHFLTNDSLKVMELVCFILSTPFQDPAV